MSNNSTRPRAPANARRSRRPLVIPDVSGLTNKEAAHLYLDAGYWPIPWRVVKVRGKSIKRPCYPRGWTYATVARETHESIERWKSSWQCGLITSRRSGILACDIDDPSGWAAWDIPEPPDTAASRTGRAGGHHLLYDGRALDVSDWPVQGDIPGGQIKSKGFIAVEPSIHPNGKPYSWYGDLRKVAPIGDFGKVLAEYRSRPSANGDGPDGDGRETDALWQAVLDAGNGMQRGAMFAWSSDAHDRGFTDDEIVDRLWQYVQNGQIVSWNKQDRWTRGGVRAYAIPDRWKHTPNARLTELDGLGDEAKRPGMQLTSSYQDDDDSMLSWLWEAYLAFGLLTQWDGEKGHGKSLVIADLAARATRGLGMPFAQQVMCGPIDVILFAEDDNVEMRKRLKAAGADLSRIHHPSEDWVAAIRREKERAEKRRGQRKRGVRVEREEETSLLLPYGAEYIARMIKESGARLAVFDPITDYIHEKVPTGIDAAVRRALDPLARELPRLGAASLATRHMNKDKKQEAHLRGGGTTAFQNRARVHLISGELARTDYLGPADYGLKMVANNYMPVVKETLCYSIADSSVKLDTSGNMVGMVEWHGTADISANVLSGAGASRRGPEPKLGIEITRILNEMLDEQARWEAEDAMEEVQKRLKAAGYDGANKETVHAARRGMGIESRKRKGDGVYMWAHKDKFVVRRRG
jgi:hypothetical protein